MLRTVIVHLDNPRRAQDLLGVAASIAEAHSARLVGLHVVPDIFIPATVPVEVTGELIEAQQRADAQAAAKIEAQFNEAMAAARVPHEWRKAQARFETVADVVMRHGRTADLIVVGQPEQKLDVFSGIDASEEIVLGSGRPVLVVPMTGHDGPIGKHILVAWKDSREAARATFDALVLLKAASSVRILSVSRPKGGARPGDGGRVIEATEIAASLARHGVKCEIVEATGPDSSVPGEILAQVKSKGCDLVVMGGYGHSRLREVVFGGATRAMFDTMTVPVLMSH